MITVSNVITVDNPSQELLKFCDEHLKLRNPEYAKKQRMHHWLGNTPQFLYLYEMRGGKLILPFGVLRNLLPMRCEDGGHTDDVIDTDFRAAESIEYNCTVPLYDYQEKAVEDVYWKQYGILQSPAGSGKTQMGIALIAKLCKRALWLTHTKDLLTQSKQRAEQYMDSSLLGTITEGKVNIGKGITFATVQTMCNLDLTQYKDYWDVIIVDECFPKDTMIQTPHGCVPIQHIVPGELIVTRNERTGKLELCQVEELQVRDIKGDLVRVTLSNGKHIVCTTNHPVFTQDGYKKAGELTNDDEVRVLRERFRYFDLESNPTIRLEKRITKTSLFKRMYGEDASVQAYMDGRTARTVPATVNRLESQTRLQTDEGKQSDVPGGDSKASIGDLKNHRASSSFTRWLRARNDSSAIHHGCKSTAISPGTGVCNPNKERSGGLSKSLQDRHSNPGQNGCYRNRRWISLLTKGSDRRYEKNGVLNRVRVESVEVLKPGSDGTFGGLCGDGKVYNLCVTHNHNYFADGVLVHNCHRVAGTPTAVSQFSKVLNSLAARHKYGLSATVHRSDGLIQATFALLGDVIYTVPTEAVADKIMKVGICPIPTGVRISRECLNTDGTLNYAKLIGYLAESDERNLRIIECIVENRENPSLILSDRLGHLETLMSMLPVDMQSDAVMVSGKMTTKRGKAEREQAIKDMRSGSKKYLFATYSLAKEGLDIPCLERLYMATPQKDYAVITQAIGRIARTFPGKADPICYDFVDDIQYLAKAYKKRCTTYRKNGCYFVER